MPSPGHRLDGPINGGGLLSEQVYDRLKAAITTGELKPGQRLVEQDLARRMSVSQSPVRDALGRLTRERMVLQLPRRGSFVAEVGIDEARQAYQVRIPLERLAAQLICQAPAPAVAEVVAGLDGDLAALRTAAAADDVAAFVDADVTFHRRVWQAAGNPLLPEIWAMIESCMRGLTTVSNRLYYPDLPTVADTHVPLVSALRDRDAARAADEFERHARDVWSSIADAHPL